LPARTQSLSAPSVSSAAVNLVQIDIVELQSLQAVVDGVQDMSA